MIFFIPFRIDRPFKLPIATIVLIGINVLLFVLSLSDLEATWELFGFRVTRGSALYTWFTHQFIHGDIFHVGWNMFYLWVFGSVVEDAAGRVRYLGLYFAGGLLAALSNAAITAVFSVPQALDIPLGGASGAVAAVMGAFAVRFYRHKLEFWYFVFFRTGTFGLPSLVAIGLWLAREVFYGIPALLGIHTGVASWAHIGGLLLGAALAASTGLLREAGKEQTAEAALQRTLMGDHAAAAADYRKLAADEPDNPDWILNKLRNERAAGRADAIMVRRDAGRAIKLLLARGDRERAADVYLEFRTDGTDLGLDRGTVQALASACEARRDFEVASKLHYELATAHPSSREGERSLFRLAHCYLELGRRDLALQAWESFTGTYPVSEWTVHADPRLTDATPDGWVPPS